MIRNNFVSNVKGSNYGTSNGEAAAKGIYIGNNCYNIVVHQNTVYNLSASAMNIYSDAHHNTLQYQLQLRHWHISCRMGKARGNFWKCGEEQYFFVSKKDHFKVYLENFYCRVLQVWPGLK